MSPSSVLAKAWPMLHNLHLRTLTRTTIIVCLPTSIKSAITKPVCATTYSVCTETGSCYGMQLCVADITTLQCVPELASMELTLSHKLLHNTACHACSWWLVLLLCILPSLRSCLAAPPWPWCLYIQKLHNCAQTALTISLPQAMQLAVTVTANGNALGWYTCSAGCMSSTNIPGLALARVAGLTNTDFTFNVHTSMHALKYML